MVALGWTAVHMPPLDRRRPGCPDRDRARRRRSGIDQRARAPDVKIFAVADAVVAAQAAVEIEDPFRLANGASDAPSDRAKSCAHRWAAP